MILSFLMSSAFAVFLVVDTALAQDQGNAPAEGPRLSELLSTGVTFDPAPPTLLEVHDAREAVALARASFETAQAVHAASAADYYPAAHADAKLLRETLEQMQAKGYQVEALLAWAAGAEAGFRQPMEAFNASLTILQSARAGLDTAQQSLENLLAAEANWYRRVYATVTAQAETIAILQAQLAELQEPFRLLLEQICRAEATERHREHDGVCRD